MIDKMRVLNRQNTMIYRDDRFTSLKTSYGSVKFNISEDEHEKILRLLRLSLECIDFEQLIEDKTDLKLLKMLFNQGSVFLFRESDDIEKYFNNKWFSIIKQYLSPDKELKTFLEKIVENKYSIRSDLNLKMPEIRKVFQEYGVDLEVINDSTEVDSKIILTANNADNANSTLLIQSYSEGIVGTFLKDVSYEKLQIDDKRLINLFAPVYILIFTLKNACGSENDTFFFNEVGKFSEYKLNSSQITVLSTSQVPVEQKPIKPKLERIENFEKSKVLAKVELSIANHTSDYADINQSGFSTYGIMSRKGNSTSYIVASTSFEDAALETIKFSLKSQLELLNGGNWLVTDVTDYYLNKVLILINKLEEKGHLLKLSREVLLQNRLYKSYKNILPELSIFVSYFSKTSSYKVYLIDEKQQIFSMGAKIYSLNEEIEKILINYLVHQSNPNKQFLSPYNFNHTIDQSNIEIIDRLPNQIAEKDFIENALDLFKKLDIRYEEFVWDQEFKLTDVSVLCRRMDVGSYGK